MRGRPLLSSSDQVPPLPMIDPCYAAMWVPEKDMKAAGARLLHTYFPDEKGRKILTYVPMKNYFALHKDPAARKILKTANMAGYFKLKPWGPYLQRAWELVHSIDKTGAATIMDFDGQQGTGQHLDKGNLGCITYRTSGSITTYGKSDSVREKSGVCERKANLQ